MIVLLQSALLSGCSSNETHQPPGPSASAGGASGEGGRGNGGDENAPDAGPRGAGGQNYVGQSNGDADGGAELVGDADSGAQLTGGSESGGAGARGADGGAQIAGGSNGGTRAGAGASGGAPATDLPALLSETGLYKDIATGLVASDVKPFTPQFALWTDGAAKRRWIRLPQGLKIDTTDMDNWTFPVGTQVWKEFSRDDKRIETRLMMRVREGGRGWKGLAYLWNDELTEASAVPIGVQNARGTAHDIPAEGDCRTCHGERADWPLGFSAVQLAHAGPGVTLNTLVNGEALSNPPTAPITLPGTDTEREIFGYLHANCGHCHRAGAIGTQRSNLRLWLNVGQLASIEETDSYSLLVNRGTDSIDSKLAWRVLGGTAEDSELYRRLSLRGDPYSMPPLGTELPDPSILPVVAGWVESLPPPEAPRGGGAQN